MLFDQEFRLQQGRRKLLESGLIESLTESMISRTAPVSLFVQLRAAELALDDAEKRVSIRDAHSLESLERVSLTLGRCASMVRVLPEAHRMPPLPSIGLSPFHIQRQHELHEEFHKFDGYELLADHVPLPGGVPPVPRVASVAPPTRFGGGVMGGSQIPMHHHHHHHAGFAIGGSNVGPQVHGSSGSSVAAALTAAVTAAAAGGGVYYHPAANQNHTATSNLMAGPGLQANISHDRFQPMMNMQQQHTTHAAITQLMQQQFPVSNAELQQQQQQLSLALMAANSAAAANSSVNAPLFQASGANSLTVNREDGLDASKIISSNDLAYIPPPPQTSTAPDLHAVASTSIPLKDQTTPAGAPPPSTTTLQAPPITQPPANSTLASSANVASKEFQEPYLSSHGVQSHSSILPFGAHAQTSILHQMMAMTKTTNNNVTAAHPPNNINNSSLSDDVNKNENNQNIVYENISSSNNIINTNLGDKTEQSIPINHQLPHNFESNIHYQQAPDSTQGNKLTETAAKQVNFYHSEQQQNLSQSQSKFQSSIMTNMAAGGQAEMGGIVRKLNANGKASEQIQAVRMAPSSVSTSTNNNAHAGISSTSSHLVSQLQPPSGGGVGFTKQSPHVTLLQQQKLMMERHFAQQRLQQSQSQREQSNDLEGKTPFDGA